MYKLIAIDMDGTLLNDQHEVPEEVRNTLDEARAQGIKIVLCSGRPIGGMRRYIKDLNLEQEEDFVIAFTGAYVQNTHTNEVISAFTLGHDDLVELYELSLKLNTPMQFFDEEGLLTPNANISKYTVFESYLNKIPLSYRKIEDVPTDLPIPNIMYIDEPAKLNKTIQALPRHIKEKYTLVKSTPYFLEFIHPDASKGNAVKSLAEQLGIKREEVMAIGDHENDVSMIKYAGCGVAMGNAIAEVKEVADVETKSNNENGVAHIIKELALQIK